jgi:formylglycine-generating enzyme required for sulfatase activity
MKQNTTVMLLVLGVSLVLTALAVILAPDLLENPGGIVLVFAGIFTAVMALGGGTIKGWVETLFGKKEEKKRAEIQLEEGVVIQSVENFHYGNSPSNSEKKDEEKPAVKQEPPLSKDEAKTTYLSALIDDFRPLSLAGMDMHSGDIKAKLPLEDIYISLNTTMQKEIEKGDKKGGNKTDDIFEQINRGENRPLTALEALVQTSDRRMVLLGAPGTGKSTFVRHLSLRMARQLRDHAEKIENWNGKPVLPVAISLGRFAESLPVGSKTGTAEMMEQYLTATIEADGRTTQFAVHVLDVLKQDGGLILFDGLDEVANLDLRPVVVQAVESFAEKYSKNKNSRFLVTCRVYSYQDARWKLTGWPQYELALFSPEQIETFIRLWYDLHTGLESGRAGEFATKKMKLLSAVTTDDPRRLYEVARYPIILTMMAIVHANNDLPDSRALVYEQCVELLLDKWQSRRSIKNRDVIRSLREELNLSTSAIYEPLYEIAFEAHKGHKGDKKRTEDSGSLITEGLIDGILHDYLKDREKIDIFLEYCKNANGLLMLRGTVTLAGSRVRRNEYTFPHLTFEEFLASRHLKNLDTEEVRALLDESHDRWRESVKFMAELYCFSKDPDRNAMNGLLESLSSPFPSSPEKKDWLALWLAGELLTYYNRALKSKKTSPFENDIVANLVKLVKSGQLSPRERADVADIVDQLAPLDDLYQFVSISQSANISISKYPVTNALYERFLKPENFKNKDLWVDFPKYDENSQLLNETWGEAGWEWLQEQLLYTDNDIQDGVLLPRYWRDPRFGVNRRHAPVVGISWYEASAYCKWLTQNWQNLPEAQFLSSFIPQPSSLVFRLPLETEWAQAAGGGEKDRFAFGELKDPKQEITAYANTSESGINRTTPVWMYPQGARPAGAMDMSGNVWEWQANYSSNDKKYLGLRGGSWDDYGDLARVSIRYNVLPYDRYYYFGFRLVAVSLPNG